MFKMCLSRKRLCLLDYRRRRRRQSYLFGCCWILLLLINSFITAIDDDIFSVLATGNRTATTTHLGDETILMGIQWPVDTFWLPCSHSTQKPLFVSLFCVFRIVVVVTFASAEVNVLDWITTNLTWTEEDDDKSGTGCIRMQQSVGHFHQVNRFTSQQTKKIYRDRCEMKWSLSKSMPSGASTIESGRALIKSFSLPQGSWRNLELNPIFGKDTGSIEEVMVIIWPHWRLPRSIDRCVVF